MKSLKVLIVFALALAMAPTFEASAQTHKWLSTEFRKQSSLTTTDSTYRNIDTVKIASNEAGILEVQVLGYNDSLSIAVTGRYAVRYKKVAGTLTMGSPEAILTTVTDTGLGTATWDITAGAYGNIYIRVKGKLGYDVYWESRVKPQKKVP